MGGGGRAGGREVIALGGSGGGEKKEEKRRRRCKTKRRRRGNRKSYKELQGRSEQQQTYWSLQGCSVLNLMHNYNTIYQSSPMIKRKLYWSK